MASKAEEIIVQLKKLGRKDALPFMQKFGINTSNALGVSIPNLRKIAKQYGKDHKLASELWSTGIHDARILASMIDEPNKVTRTQFDAWTSKFNSWDLCDQVCMNLFQKSAHALEKAIEYTRSPQEFRKRAGFVIMAVGAVHWKSVDDELFESFFPLIKQEATDDRNFVKKAVSWALRQIGKRNEELKKKVYDVVKELEHSGSKPERWIARDVRKDLEAQSLRKKSRYF